MRSLCLRDLKQAALKCPFRHLSALVLARPFKPTHIAKEKIAES